MSGHRLAAALADHYRIERPSEVVLAMDLVSLESWDLHPDGKRIVVAVNNLRVGAPPSSAVAGSGQPARDLVVQNWFAQLRRLTDGTKQ